MKILNWISKSCILGFLLFLLACDEDNMITENPNAFEEQSRDCCISSGLIYSEGEVYVYIPGAYSPNFDGFNDIFVVFVNDRVEEIESIRIFHADTLVLYRTNVDLSSRPMVNIWEGPRFEETDSLNRHFNYQIKLITSEGLIELEGVKTAIRCIDETDKCIKTKSCFFLDQGSLYTGQLDSTDLTNELCYPR